MCIEHPFSRVRIYQVNAEALAISLYIESLASALSAERSSRQRGALPKEVICRESSYIYLSRTPSGNAGIG